MMQQKTLHRQRRKKRIRSKIQGTAARPRLTVYRSLQHLWVQLIDDEAGKTIAAASTKELKASVTKKGASSLGELIASKAKEAKISTVVFDRNAYKYHGRIKELADAARKGGLRF